MRLFKNISAYLHGRIHHKKGSHWVLDSEAYNYTLEQKYWYIKGMFTSKRSLKIGSWISYYPHTYVLALIIKYYLTKYLRIDNIHVKNYAPEVQIPYEELIKCKQYIREELSNMRECKKLLKKKEK